MDLRALYWNWTYDDVLPRIDRRMQRLQHLEKLANTPNGKHALERERQLLQQARDYIEYLHIDDRIESLTWQMEASQKILELREERAILLKNRFELEKRLRSYPFAPNV